MGIPAEDIGDISSAEESGSSQPNPDDASAFPGKPVDDEQDGEEEPKVDARSTQFGLPAVDREESQEETGAQEPVAEPSDSQAGEEGRTGNWTGWKEEAESGPDEEPSEESVLSAWGISEASEASSDEQPPPEERETVQGTESAEGVEGAPRDTHKTQMGMPRFDPDELSPEEADRGNDPTQKFDEDSLAKVEEHVKELNRENAEQDEPKEASPGAGVVNPASSSGKSEERDGGQSVDTGSTLHGQIPGAEGPGSYSTSSGSYRAADVDDDSQGGASEAAGDSQEAAGRQGRQTMRGLMGKDLSDGESSGGGQQNRREEPGLEDTAQGGPTARPPESDEEPGLEDTAQGGPTAGPPESEEEPEPPQEQPGQSGFGSGGPTGFKVDEPSEEIAIDGGVADNPFNPEASNAPRLQEESDDQEHEGRQQETSSVSEILGDLDESDEEAAEPATDNVAEAAAEATDESDEFGFFDSDDDSGFNMPAPDEIAVSVEEDDEEFESDAFVEPVEEEAAESADEAQGATAESLLEDSSSDEPVVEDSGTGEPTDSTPSDPPAGGEQEESEPAVDAMEEEREPGKAQAPPESAAPAEPDEALPDEDEADAEQPEPTDDEERQLADLSQTVFGLIAGVSMGSFLVVQMMTIGFMGHPFFLALGIGGAIGGVGSLLLPLLPLDSGIRSVSFVGIGMLISALAVAATVSGQALAVAPLIALFGGIFALGAGLIPIALSIVGD